MVIDVHTHIFESLAAFPKVWVDELYQSKVASLGKEVADRFLAGYDGRVEALIKDMDEAGVDKSVVLPLDFAIMCRQEPEISVWRANEYAAEAQSKYPDRIIAFVGVDPLRRDAVELLETAVTKWGLKGVKIYPTTFRVTDDVVQPFMKKVNELEIPALFHQGSDPLPYVIKYGNPVDLDTLTLLYPKMKIIAAHYAPGYENILTGILRYKQGRIYADLALMQGYEWRLSPWHFTMQMRYWMDKFPRSILMGSDWPFMRRPPVPSHKEWFDIIRNLKIPKQVLELGLGIKDFTQEEKDMILGENARSLLKI